MCWEQSPQKRTMATSRSEATTTEPEPQNETVVRTQESPPPTNPEKPDIRPALPLRSQPDRNRFRLTSSFRNGHIARTGQTNIPTAHPPPPPPPITPPPTT